MVELDEKSEFQGLTSNNILPCPLFHAICEIRGRRHEMEDTHRAFLHPHFSRLNEEKLLADGIFRRYFAIFDGHGGISGSKYCWQHLHQLLSRNDDLVSNPKVALNNTIIQIDKDFLSVEPRSAMNAGCTVIVTYMHNNTLYVGNLGDSRVILCNNGIASPLTEDHKPNRADEKKRIEANGGVIARTVGGYRAVLEFNQRSNFHRFCCFLCFSCEWKFFLDHSRFDVPRIWPGGIALSRTIGDGELKPHLISSQPEITSHNIVSSDEFCIMACDGVWDVLSNQQAVDIVRSVLLGQYKHSKPIGTFSIEELKFFSADDRTRYSFSQLETAGHTEEPVDDEEEAFEGIADDINSETIKRLTISMMEESNTSLMELLSSSVFQGIDWQMRTRRACDALVEAAYHAGSTDNITAIVILFGFNVINKSEFRSSANIELPQALTIDHTIESLPDDSSDIPKLSRYLTNKLPPEKELNGL